MIQVIYSRWIPTLIGALVFLPRKAAAQAESASETPWFFSPVAEPAGAILDFGLLITLICAGIFFTVSTALVYTLIRYRERPGDEGHEPAQVYGSEQLELAWTITPVLIVIVLSLITAGRIFVLQKDEPPPNSLSIRVVGHQWWWEFQYKDYDFITANELHLPVSKTAFLDLESQDVIHSFWVPQLSGKTDLIPNRVNHMWIEPKQTGLFVGQCAEYCGTQHAHMLLRVFVHSDEDFQAWVAEQQKDAEQVASARIGEETFVTTACVNCHTVRGVTEIGQFGPDLTHLMSRTTIGAGAAPNDKENLVAWITNPDHFKPGARMPAMKLDAEQINHVADYLMTLK
ncbi:MAG: cytochrome c oxidase subunit II [Myxococcota bacterium]